MITLYDKAGKAHEFEETFKQEMLNVGYTVEAPKQDKKEKPKRGARSFKG